MKIKEQVHHDLKNDKIIVQSTYDSNPTLERAEQLRKAKVGITGENKLVGTIPIHIVKMWCDEAGIKWSDIKDLRETGINWNDISVLSDAGVNWTNIGDLSASGINWTDIDVLSDAGINWNDIKKRLIRRAYKWNTING